MHKHKIAGRHFNRVIEDVTIKFSKFSGKIYITDFSLENSLSSIFSISVNFVTDHKLRFKDIINSRVVFEFVKPGLKFHACVLEFEESIDSENQKDVSSPYFFNKVILLGEMFMLTKNVRCRVYNVGNPADHIKTLFKEYSINLDIKLSIIDKKLICQYNESDYDFFCRICNHYKIGYYYNPKTNKYIIHDKDTYLDKVKLDLDIPFIVNHKQERASIVHTARTKWSTNTVLGNYDPQSNKYKNSMFLQSYYKSNVLKQISENYFHGLNKTTYIFDRLATPVFAGCKFNDKVVKKITIDDTTIRNIRIECFDKGIEIPVFNNNRHLVVANGMTQLEIDKSHDNQNIIDNENDIPIKMFFDTKVLIRARQYSYWLGKFYGYYFPIREQTEVSVMFLDDLMSCAIIISCYPNNSNSRIMSKDYVGIVTSTIGTSSQEKFMNKILFKDRKDEEQVLFEGKKDILMSSNNDITFKTTKTINSETEKAVYKVSKDINMEAKENICIKAKDVQIDSQSKQEIKSDDSFNISTKNKISLSSSQIVIGDKELNVNCKKISISANVFDIKSDNLSIKSKMLNIESNVMSLKIKMLNIEINLLKLQVKIMMIESSLMKIEGKLIMMDGKSIILKSPAVVVL